MSEAMQAAMGELRHALRGVDLDSKDERLLAWLGRWDPATVTRVASLVERARRAEGGAS